MLLKRFRLSVPDVGLALVEIERFREHLALLDCPSCASKTLKLVDYVQGPKGWGCRVFCAKCLTKGEINNDGFHVELSEAKNPERGKTKTQAQKVNEKRELDSSQ
jgi:hypothetical protein